MQRNMSLWVKSVLASSKRLAIPIMTHPGIDLTGHTVYETVHSPQLHSGAVRAVSEAYPTGASTMIMDLSVEAEAFGAKVRFSDNEVPSVTERCVYDAESIERLAIPNMSQGRLDQWVESARLAAMTIIDRPVLAGCIGPFSLAARLYDVTEIMTAILTEPECILPLVDKCTQFLISYVRAFKSVGANGIVIAEPVAGVLSPDLCTQFSSDFVRRIVQSVQDESFLVILHNCGDTDSLIASMYGTGAAAFHFGNRCNITSALEQLPSDILVLGNLDPVGVFKSGTPETVRAETEVLLQATKRFPNFVISSGCDVPPNVPLKNIDAFFDALAAFNRA
ncbi:MAG: uroporphyrinogen decarboxylase family protein [Ignavibacteriales bacterium]|nr:uroporphyrinogen decarboxylase family protein [Ignavibacteriales bacterium]